jgi:6-phosphogluconolactonase
VQVHPDGRFVFGSNREHDSIAIFEIDQGSGEIGLVDIVPSGGHRPRCLRVDPTGELLFAGNRGSDNVVSFRIDRQSGKLERTGSSAAIARPACINFLWI